jgi:phosphatidate cytidylyltransferase
LLRTRILSALVLAPLVLLAIWFGGYAFLALVALAAGLMGWEWARMTGGGKLNGCGIAIIAILMGSAGALFWALNIGSPAASISALAILIGGATVATTIPVLLRSTEFLVAGPAVRSKRAMELLFLLVGTVYIGLACLAFLWLRLAPFNGPVVVFWLLAVVWATDIGAYFAGRGLGGPKLAPRVSPNKTWAGLIGGMIAAAAVSAVAAVVLDWTLLAPVLGGALLAVVAQGGDLLESWSKRRFGVKDSSHIIPGHGGILDRVDGLLSVFPVAFLYFWAVGASF